MSSPKIGAKRGGKYANGMVPPEEPSIGGFIKDRAQAAIAALTPAPTRLAPIAPTPVSSVMQPIVNTVTDAGLTGSAAAAAMQRNDANRAALELANGAVSIKGPGTGTSDSIHGVSLSKGESVLPAATTRALGARNIANMIEATNGRPPAIGARVGGNHADGVVPSASAYQTGVGVRQAIKGAAKGAARFLLPAPELEAVGREYQKGVIQPTQSFTRGVLGVEPTAGAIAAPIQGAEPPYGNEEAKILGNSANVIASQQATQPPVTTPAPDASTPSGGTLNVMPASAMGATDPRLLRQLSEARQAAAARGDWNAVNASYGAGGLRGDGSGVTATGGAPDFSQYPNTIEGVLARKAAMQNFAMNQSAANKQAELGVRRQEAGTHSRMADIQGANIGSEMGIREMQGQEMQQQIAQKKQLMTIQNEMMTPGISAERKTQLSELLHGLRGSGDMWMPYQAKDEMNMPTGDVVMYNRATGETKPMGRTSAQAPTGKVTRAQVDAAAKAKGITDPSKLNELYKTYGV